MVIDVSEVTLLTSLLTKTDNRNNEHENGGSEGPREAYAYRHFNWDNNSHQTSTGLCVVRKRDKYGQ